VTDPVPPEAPGPTPADAGARKSPRLGLLGCGCGAIVVGLLLLMLAFTYLAWRQSERLKSGYDNPEEAAARVREVLHYDELPDGYYPLGGASVPVFFRLALLTDLPPEEREGGEGARRFHRSGFIFFSTFSLRSDDSELLRYFREGPKEGDKEMDLNLPKDGIAGDLGMDFEAREVIARGSEPVQAGRVYYVARRGGLEVSGDAFEGLATLFYLKCDEGHRVRFGLWFAPDPETADLQGTPGDPKALADFLGHFWICG
jgi:hypothetical protein